MAITREPFHLQKKYDQFWKAEDNTFQEMVLEFQYLQYFGRDGVFRERRRKLKKCRNNFDEGEHFFDNLEEENVDAENEKVENTLKILMRKLRIFL